jgi:hypothetical protein
MNNLETSPPITTTPIMPNSPTNGPKAIPSLKRKLLKVTAAFGAAALGVIGYQNFPESEPKTQEELEMRVYEACNNIDTSDLRRIAPQLLAVIHTECFEFVVLNGTSVRNLPCGYYSRSQNSLTEQIIDVYLQYNPTPEAESIISFRNNFLTSINSCE